MQVNMKAPLLIGQRTTVKGEAYQSSSGMRFKNKMNDLSGPLLTPLLVHFWSTSGLLLVYFWPFSDRFGRSR